MFNEAIDVLDQWFLRERTYFISNGLVKPVNPKYASAHKEIEIGLSIHTQVEEAKMSIKLDRFKYDFIPLQDVNDSIKSNGIIGTSLLFYTKLLSASNLSIFNLIEIPLTITYWVQISLSRRTCLGYRC